MIKPPQNLLHLLEFHFRLLNRLPTIRQRFLIIGFVFIARFVLAGAEMLDLFAGVFDLC